MDNTMTINGRTYSEDEIREVKEMFINTFGELGVEVKEAFRKIAESIKEIFDLIYNNQLKEKMHDYNWRVPIKIEMPEMPYISTPKTTRIRNNI